MFQQVVIRDLTEAAIFRVPPTGDIQTFAIVNPDERAIPDRMPRRALPELQNGQPRIATDAADRIEAVVKLDPTQDLYLYVSRRMDTAALAQWREAQSAVSDYRITLNRSRDLQLRFNAILLIVSLLLIAIVIFIALKLADRLVRPVRQLVSAARQVTAGDLSARVSQTGGNDEVAVLGAAFNRMTRRLEEQRSELITANAQLDSRRAFTEAVLSGVTAGVLSVDEERIVRLINSQAEALLKTGGKSPVGQKLVNLAPELDRLLVSEEREDVVQLASSGEPRTLAVKTVQVKGGHVLTFDDITEQLLDQRRAAWSDVARRIAHEIKNPLTPIQLAAERLQRRYGAEVAERSRHVREADRHDRPPGRRPSPDGRRILLLRADAEAGLRARNRSATSRARPCSCTRSLIRKSSSRLDAPEPAPMLVCDRRLLGQALTNIVKNGVEAIQQKHEEGKAKRSKQPDRVAIAIREEGSKIAIEVTDTGIGLPSERARMTEPYMTTRAKGTGLGLAIVKKIVEEHFGQIDFDDRAGRRLADPARSSIRVRSPQLDPSVQIFRRQQVQVVDLMALDILIVDDEQDIQRAGRGRAGGRGLCAPHRRQQQRGAGRRSMRAGRRWCCSTSGCRARSSTACSCSRRSSAAIRLCRC